MVKGNDALYCFSYFFVAFCLKMAIIFYVNLYGEILLFFLSLFSKWKQIA